MNRWIKLLIIITALVVAGATTSYWAGPLIQFIGVNSSLIQGVADAVQTVIWAIAGIVAIVGWIRRPRPAPSAASPAPREAPMELEAENGSLVNTGEIKDSTIVTGKEARVVHTGTYIEKVETQIIKGAPNVDPKTLRVAYLNRLLYFTRELSLAGIDPQAASEPTAALKLDAVYTALRTMTPEDQERLEQGKKMDRETRYLSALEQLNRRQYLVLLGDPGSGKSTFVNFVALCLTGEGLGMPDANLTLLTAPLPDEEKKEKEAPRPQPWNHGALLPVRVILRDFAARGLPRSGQKATAGHLWNFIRAELKALSLENYADHLQQELLDKGGLILLDGLDEVPEAQQRRIQIKQAVEEFKAVYRKCRILITSRTYAYQKQDWRLPEFQETILAPFSHGQIEAFVEHWYEHVGSLRGWPEDKYRGGAALLKRAISGSQRLGELAGRPLLLTLMASLHAWRGGTLPEKREELYANAVDLLLDWWEKPKIVRDAQGAPVVLQPSLSEWLNLGRQKVRDLLNELAYTAHAAQPELQGTADIPESKLVEGLLKLSGNPDLKPQRLVEYLSQRAGLLLPRGVEVYTFPHRTFQEYLAACYLTDHDFPDAVAELAGNDPNRWREVALLAAAKAARGSASTIWGFIEALCYRDCDNASPAAKALWGAHLAGQALLEIVDTSKISERNQPKVERVKTWLVHLLSRADFPALERAEAGRNLARLGDPRREALEVDALQFCCVPAGPFWMGSEEADREKPLHLNEQLDKPCWISKFPITNAQYRRFVEDGGYGQEGYWREAKAAKVWQGGKIKAWNDDTPREAPFDFGAPFHLPNHPVVGITWYEALAFTRWLTGRWQKRGWLPRGGIVRLPSEAEWEKAARGGEKIPSAPVVRSVQEWSIANWQFTIGNWQLKNNQRRYPWGDEPDPNRANYADTGIGSPSAVGCFPAEERRGDSRIAPAYGCEEMSGNVWEWCQTQWRGNYQKPANESLEGTSARVVRGGAFGSPDGSVRCAYRIYVVPDSRNYYLGFRVSLFPFTSGL